MKTWPALLIVPLLLAGAAPPPARDGLTTLLIELRRSDLPAYGCFDDDGGILVPGGAAIVARSYQKRHRLESEATARALLAGLIEYGLRPSDASWANLQAALRASGSLPGVAEDVCECAYYHGGRDERVARLSSLEPPAAGRFWAARVLHERGRPAEALPLYAEALAVDEANPRTRLFLAIALVAEGRPAEALTVLRGIPDNWAPEPVAYWRGRALVESARPAEAIPLLAALKPRWGKIRTTPDASVGSGPVQPASPTTCLLGRARAEAGDRAGARALLTTAKNECAGELARLDLAEDRPFEALLGVVGGSDDDQQLLVRALLDLRACDWARHELGWRRERCREEPSSGLCSLVTTIGPPVDSACPPSDSDAESVPSALETRLKAPRVVVFEERPIPDAQRWIGKRAEPPTAKRYPGLGQAALVAVSPRALRMFAVSVSHDVDPRGEVSSGGYWLHLSADRGVSWRGPFYLGFAEQFPYVVLPTTHVRPFDGERLNLEVERREVDESTITFPPVGLRAKNVQKDLYLSVDIAAVERDSDGDGLTDLLEEKLALDATSADTEGDGLADGVDPLPLQPRMDEEASERGQLLAAVLPHLFGGPPPVQHTATEKGEGSAMHLQPRPFASARTLFVSSDGQPLPHAAGLRVVALPAAALSAYHGKFGATYPMGLPEIAFDRDRRRALIQYSFGWRGGTLLAEKKEGRWIITPRGAWIT